MRADYRPEIDGLRAVAVVPVMLFHAGAPAWRGGFAGVDVFFVISGYLVTRLLLADEGAPSLPAFYERRVRRLLPALAVVLAASTAAAWWWLLPADLEAYSRSLLSVLGLGANIYLWRATGDYFAGPAEAMPLLHTWSLGVEEQFYLAYPLALRLTHGLGRARQRALVAAACLASLMAATWAVAHAPIAAFFLLPTRAWELALGALVAWWEPRWQPWLADPDRARWRSALGWLGLAAIAGGIATLSPSSRMPGLAALAPTLGTAAVIVGATPVRGAGRLLASAPLIGIGLVSYSAYLWHQPLLAFGRAAAGLEPALTWRLAAVAAALLLAWGTWWLVERPWRDRRRTSTRAVVVAATVAIVTLAGAGTAGVLSHGGLARYQGLDRALLAGEFEGASYVVTRFDARKGAPWDTADPRRRLLVIGDSYAQDLVNALAEAGLDREVQISTRYIAHYCGNLYLPLEQFTPRPADYDTTRCAPTLPAGDAELRARLADADVVWLASFWQPWQVPLLPASLRALAHRTAAPVRVFGPKHFGIGPLRALLGRSVAERQALTRAVSPDTAPVVRAMRDALPADRFVDVQRLLCGPDARVCRVFTPDDALLSYDGAHLTRAGARYYGHQLATRDEVVAELRR